MVEEITLHNYSLPGRSITLNRTNSNYLIDDDGLDWGTVSSNISTVNNFDSIGAKIRAIDTSTPRDIKIVGWVVGTDVEMRAKKHVLSQIIAPQSEIAVTVENKTISTIATKTVEFGTSKRTNNECMCQFQISLSAAYGFFEYARTYTNLQSDDAILNLGDIPVGAQVYFHFTSTTTDPLLVVRFSNNREKAIGLFGTFNSGETVQVDTRYGSKIVERGATKDFSILNTMLDWFEIPVSYTPEDVGTITLSAGVQVNMYYKESFSILENL